MGCILIAMGVLEVRSAAGESQSWDEGIHISAGYTYLTRGDYSWNIEHPPLAKLMSALPLLRLAPDIPDHLQGWKKHDETEYGLDFLYRNRVPADTLLMAARSSTILLTLLFGAALAWWTRRRFGTAAALLALVLYAFDPNIIAHGRYVITDVPVMAFYFFACVLWVEYLESGRFRDLAVAALLFALAMVTKFSAIILIPTLPLLYAVAWAQRPKEFPWRRLGVAFLTVAVTLWAVTVVVYWPETMRCLHNTRVSRLKDIVDRRNAVGNTLYWVGKKLRLHAHTFWMGLNSVGVHNSEGHASYLMGQRSKTGWWYYFPVAFTVKSTVAALIAASVLLAGLWPAARRFRFRATPLIWIGLVLPPLFYFAVSMTGRIDIGIRHILPVYPFLYVAAAALVARLNPRKLAVCGVLVLGALQIAECASIAPDYLAFFNVLAGGPGNGPHYLVDSNIDWGQDMKKLALWLNAHGTHRARIDYFGPAPVDYFGVQGVGFPDPQDRKGWEDIDDFAVACVTPLYGVYRPLENLAPLRLRQPVAKIGWSMYVYDLRKLKSRPAH